MKSLKKQFVEMIGKSVSRKDWLEKRTDKEISELLIMFIFNDLEICSDKADLLEEAIDRLSACESCRGRTK